MMNASQNALGALIKDVSVSAYKVPTDQLESDGTLKWDSTTMVMVEVKAGDRVGIGYTYASEAAATLIHTSLVERVEGSDPFDVPGIWQSMKNSIRNEGHCGVAFMALSAVDNALWDLKAKLLELPLVQLLGQVRSGMPVYGSGGFTSYSIEKLQDQLSGWVDAGIPRVKMKVGRHPGDDVHRVAKARQAIGPDAALFVDANGGYTVKQALNLALEFIERGVSWLEEPVSSDNLEGLHRIRNEGPPKLDITAGEYGYRLSYFKRMLQARAVDVLQADATRCGGITGFLRAATLADAWHIPFSSHCAPSIHLHAAPATATFRHAEYFHDHVRIENMFFDGFRRPVNGVMKPDLSRPGLGLEFKHEDAKKYEL